MDTVWKYELGRKRVSCHAIPESPLFLTVQMQFSSMCVWAQVDDTKPKRQYWFIVMGTGHEMPTNPYHAYVGTFQEMGGVMVFHVFVYTEPPKGGGWDE
jgi:hypothetical protein